MSSVIWASENRFELISCIYVMIGVQIEINTCTNFNFSIFIDMWTAKEVHG